MGLDTYAGRSPEEPQTPEEAWEARYGCTDADLRALRSAQKKRERLNDGYCVFEGNYFRGKLYVDLVQYVTGVRLTEDWIPAETVKAMAEAFEQCDPEETLRGFEDYEDAIYDHSSIEFEDLREFFRVCARRGLGLVASQ